MQTYLSDDTYRPAITFDDLRIRLSAHLHDSLADVKNDVFLKSCFHNILKLNLARRNVQCVLNRRGIFKYINRHEYGAINYLTQLFLSILDTGRPNSFCFLGVTKYISPSCSVDRVQ